MLNKLLYTALALSILLNIGLGIGLANFTKDIRELKFSVALLENSNSSNNNNYLEAVVSALEARVRDLERY